MVAPDPFGALIGYQAQRPALILGRTASPVSGGSADIDSGGSTYTSAAAIVSGLPAGSSLTIVRVGREPVIIGPGGYFAP